MSSTFLFITLTNNLTMKRNSNSHDKPPPSGKFTGGGDLRGAIGIAITPLASIGKVKIGDQIITAICDDGFIQKGRRVRIIGQKMSYYLVRLV